MARSKKLEVRSKIKEVIIQESNGNTDQRLVLPLFISGLVDASKLVVKEFQCCHQVAKTIRFGVRRPCPNARQPDPSFWLAGRVNSGKGVKALAF